MDLRLLLFPALILPMGVVVFLLASQAWESHTQARTARRWPQTSGKVLTAGVRETSVRVRRSTSIRRYRMATRYAPHVQYGYWVNDVSYQGQRLHMGPAVLSSEAGDAQQEAARYPVGSQVTVYYNPADPAESTLDPRVSRGTWLLWATALIALVVTFIIAGVILSIPPIRL